jgi:hypothetical protein
MTESPRAGTAEPAPGTRPALTAIDVLAFFCEVFAFFTFAFWGFAAWHLPWNIVFGIGTPIVAVVVWALFVSPRAVVPVHPYVRAVIELLVYAGATIAWWSLGLTWVGVIFAAVAILVGVLAGRRRIA